MKNFRSILPIILLTVLLSSNVFARKDSRPVDSLAIAAIFETAQISIDTVEFDLQIYRTSESWLHWANGTFQFRFDSPGFDISEDLVGVHMIEGSSDLNAYLSGEDVYSINCGVIKDRISIFVVGPEKYPETVSIPLDQYIKVGRFAVYTRDGSEIPNKIKWVTPYERYQACAFKIHDDGNIPDYLFAVGLNDNVEMYENVDLEESRPATIIFKQDDSDPYRFLLEYFNATYAGERRVGLNWKTTSEVDNLGFIVKRGLKPYGIEGYEMADDEFPDIVASYKMAPNEDNLKGQGNSRVAKEYRPASLDFVEQRRRTYCYRLYYEDFKGEVHDIATDCAEIPRAVIEYANPKPNPFEIQTIIDFTVSDDVIMTATARDLLGREIRKLTLDGSSQVIHNIEVERGDHYIVFRAPELASQGLYDIILIAYPIDDPTTEISRAVIKVQHIKNR